jgi:hypothetical protein
MVNLVHYLEYELQQSELQKDELQQNGLRQNKLQQNKLERTLYWLTLMKITNDLLHLFQLLFGRLFNRSDDIRTILQNTPATRKTRVLSADSLDSMAIAPTNVDEQRSIPGRVRMLAGILNDPAVVINTSDRGTRLQVGHPLHCVPTPST